MANTYDLIVKTSLTGSTDLQNIPQTYTDLRIVCLGQNAGSSPNLSMRFNGITSAIYARNYISRDNNNYANYRESGQTGIEITNSYQSPDTNIFSIWTIDIINYRSTRFKTTIHGIYNPTFVTAGNGSTGAAIGLFRETSAISSIQFSGGTTGRVYVYGIKGA
jgi:hypothetical protein